MKTRQYRRRAGFSRRCVRCWVRCDGKVLRMLHVSDYRPCEQGGDPRLFIKLLDHTRFAPGVQLSYDEGWVKAQLLPALVPGQWVEVVIQRQGENS